MTVATLPMPKCSMGDGLDKLGYAGDALESARSALAHLAEVGIDESARGVVECVIATLARAAEDHKIGVDAVAFEHNAFKAWEARQALKREMRNLDFTFYLDPLIGRARATFTR